MNINPTIFREYDIRGVAGGEFTPEMIDEYEKWYGPFPGITITPEAAEAIGRAYGDSITRAGGKRVLIGHEIRPFAEKLKRAFIAGAAASGCDMTDIGAVLTPIVYFTVATENFDGGVNVTGSHNVYFYNGFKMMKKGNWPFYGAEIQDMRRAIAEGKTNKATHAGKITQGDAITPYKEFIMRDIAIARKLKIVIDTGNGSAGLVAPDLFRALGCDVIELYTMPDARFPNHVPDPEQRQFMKDLADTVRNEQADLGIAFDADGDRVGFVDEAGEFVDADLTVLALSRDALSRHPGKKILYDVKCTQLFEELVPQWGGVALMHRTGHAPIKETLRKNHDIILAGEKSGHIYFVERYHKIDDGLYAGARVLELFAAQDKPFSTMFEGFPKRVRTPEFKLPCEDEKKFRVVEAIRDALAKRFEIITIDGVRFRTSPTSWGLVRASNTSPYLTVHAESATNKEVIAVKNVLADELERFPEVGDRLNRNAVATLTGKLGWV